MAPGENEFDTPAPLGIQQPPWSDPASVSHSPPGLYSPVCTWFLELPHPSLRSCLSCMDFPLPCSQPDTLLCFKDQLRRHFGHLNRHYSFPSLNFYRSFWQYVTFFKKCPHPMTCLLTWEKERNISRLPPVYQTRNLFGVRDNTPTKWAPGQGNMWHFYIVF